MRDIETLLREATKVIGKDDAAQREWIESLTDEEKALICGQFNAFVKSLTEWIRTIKEAMISALVRIKEIYEALEYAQEGIEHIGEPIP